MTIDLKNKNSIEALREIITKMGMEAEISGNLEPAEFNNYSLSCQNYSPYQAIIEFTKITGVKE